MQRYVIDSSVFNKLYLDEPDRDKAQRLFVKAAATEISISRLSGQNSNRLYIVHMDINLQNLIIY